MTNPNPSTAAENTRDPRSLPMHPLLSILIMALVSTASIALYDRWRYRPVMSVDIERIMQTRMASIQDLMTQENNRDLIVERSMQWSRDLASAIEDMQRDYDAIVLARPAVVGGAIDMTDYIEARIAR